MVCIPWYVHNMPYFIKSKMPVIIKITPIYVASNKGEKMPVIMVYHIFISEILKCEKVYLRINQTQYLHRTGIRNTAKNQELE